MDLAAPRFVPREELFAGRPERAVRVRFAGLWVAGSLAGLAQATVAVVGSRAPSEGGRSRAKTLAAALADAGVCVISGLAFGIDACAHSGAVERGRATIAVLGGGHRHLFPARNRPLAEAMLARGGAVLSPFAPETPARPRQFLQRNAIVAALADVVVVVEAADRSGALNTARWASDLDIDVLAFPGDVDRSVAAGCNALIRDGATLVRGAGDVLEALGRANGLRLPTRQERERERHAGDPRACAVVDALCGEARSVDALAEVTGLSAGDLVAALICLEIDGTIERRDGTNWALRP